ncbi:MAG: hypothetical protein FD136_1913, partial [Chitinophagaceae bacterium]
NIIPNYSEIPTQFQGILVYLLASLVYHYDWINLKDNNNDYINVHKDHPIHISRVFTSGIIGVLKKRLLDLGCADMCSPNNTTMIPTGIPSSIAIKSKCEQLVIENQMLRVELAKMKSELLDQMPGLVVNQIKQECSILGLQQLTATDLKNIIVSTINECSSSHTNSTSPSTNNDNHSQSTLLLTENGYRYYNWGGKIGCKVPQNWELPELNCKALIDCFITGINDSITGDSVIRPFRLLDSVDLNKSIRSSFSKAKFLFESIINHYNGNHADQIDINSLTIAQWDVIWVESFDLLSSNFNGKRSNCNEMSHITAYDKIKYPDKKTKVRRTNDSGDINDGVELS